MTILNESKKHLSYDRRSPFLSSVKQRYVLNKKGSSKATFHVALDLKDSGITYEPGDSVGILPQNDLKQVSQITSFFNADEQLLSPPRIEGKILFREFLMRHADFSKITKRLLETFSNASLENPSLIDYLLEDKKNLEDFDIPRLLAETKPKNLSAEALSQALLPLLPRFYSISSSQKVVGDEVHLLVATFTYSIGDTVRSGVGSAYLAHTEEKVPLYIQKAPHFKLPQDNSIPLLMIGPGTGVAPYRAFVQERLLFPESKGKQWLFFGERNSSYDFYYEDFWRDAQNRDYLKIDTAFSRDQKEKIYVQHRLLENAKEIWQWIRSDCCIYICGDAKQMAKDVMQALETIVSQQGAVEDPKIFVRNLKKERRLLLDVY